MWNLNPLGNPLEWICSQTNGNINAMFVGVGASPECRRSKDQSSVENTQDIAHYNNETMGCASSQEQQVVKRPSKPVQQHAHAKFQPIPERYETLGTP